MIRRALPVAAAAAAMAFVPTAASATPDQARVDNYSGHHLYALVEDVVLPDGRHVTAHLMESSGTNERAGTGLLFLDVWTTYDCGTDTCSAHSFGSTYLTAEQVRFDRSLRTASVQDVPVEVVDPSYFPAPWPEEDPGTGGEEPWTGDEPPAGGEEPWTGEDPSTGDEPSTGEDSSTGDGTWTGEEPWTGDDGAWVGDNPEYGSEDPGYEDPGYEAPGDGEYQPEPDWDIPAPAAPTTVTVSLSFTGTGTVDRTASHQTMCGDGERECQSIRVEAARGATARLSLDALSAEATGRLFYGHSVDAAAPKFVHEGN